MIILREHRRQILGDEDGIIVAEDIPPNTTFAAVDGFFDDARDTDGGAVAAGEGVREARGVGGDEEGERRRLGRWFVEEEEGAGGVRGVPEREEGEAAGEGGGGGGDGEEEVAEGGGGVGGCCGGLVDEEVGRGGIRRAVVVVEEVESGGCEDEYED